MASPGGRISISLTLGFAAGLVFAWAALRTGEPPSRPVAAPKAGPAPSSTIPDAPRGQASLGEVEVLFMTWGGYCVWRENLTQFAVWNGTAGKHADFFEVRRSGPRFYFRTLPQADWPLIDHGRVVRCALWFAEPREDRERFYRENPGIRPGQLELVDRPARPPLLPPLPPQGELAEPPAGLTPAPGLGRLVPPWEAEGRK